MHRADKAVLRLGVGLGLSVLIAYGFALKGAFVVCLAALLLLCKPGPPIPFVKGMVFAAVIAALLMVGVLMVPILEHYRVTGLLLTGALLYAVFFAGARSGNPLTIFPVAAVTFIPVAGVAEQALAMGLSQAIGVGLAIGALVSGFSHALFPDPPSPAPIPASRAAVSAEEAGWGALQATLVVMPVFVVALTNPALYLAAIMKTVTVAQQAGATNAHTAGRELVGSTFVGALIAAVVWAGLSMQPNLWMLMLWIVAAALWVGVRLFRVKPTSEPPSFWLNVLITMFILLGPGIEDAAVGKDVYRASATRVALFVGVALYAWATVWAFERWRAFRSGSHVLKRT
jgi:hypothetical protein